MRHLKVPLFLIASLLFAATLAPSPAAEAQSIAEYVRSVEVEGDVLYVTVDFYDEDYRLQGGELRVYDISDALAPVQVGVLPVPGRIASPTFDGDFAYLGIVIQTGDGYDRATWVVDISDPTNPTVLDQSLGRSSFRARGRYLYVPSSGDTLSIYRVDDDGHPQLVSSTAFPQETELLDVSPSAVQDNMDEDLVLDWPYLYAFGTVTAYENQPPKPPDSFQQTTRRFDVSDPTNPVAAGEYIVPNTQLESFSVRNGVFYTTDCFPSPGCESELVVADIDGGWHRYFNNDADVGFQAYDFEMVWGRYLFVSTWDGFTVRDFGEFSFANGMGNAPIIHQETSLSFSYVDAAYHYEQGVIYLAGQEGGLGIRQAPFPTPILDHDTYFPLAAW